MEPITTIGAILVTEQQRDAIHIAILPIVAGERLSPGEHVGLLEDGSFGQSDKPLGIIDPFLTVKPKKGDSCWLFLYPNTITSLRHEWMHPALNSPQPGRISHDDHVTKSRTWISEHAAVLGLTADVLMENAKTWLDYDDHIVQQGSERWRDNFNPTEFWHHYEVVTGAVVDDNKKQSFYCCSC